MVKTRKQICFSIVMSIMLGTFVSGCGDDGSSSGGSSSGAGNSPSASAANDNKSGAVTVNWWSWNPSKETGQAFVDAFNKTHPNIKLVKKDYEYNDYLNALKLAMMSGEGPDIFGVQSGEMMKQYGEFMADMTPLAEKEWGKEWPSRYYDLGLKQLQSDGKTTALPFFLSAAGYLWYNKTIMDENGVQPPKTFDEWVEVSKKLSEKSVTPFLQGAKDAWVNYDMFLALANELSPGKVYDAEAGKVPWTDPDLVKAMTYWKKLFDNGIMQKGALGISVYPDVHDKWAKGEGAMILLGTWNNDHMTKTGTANMKKSLGITKDYQFLPVNFPDINGDGKPGRLFGGPDVAFALNKDSKVKDAAWEAMKWFESEEAQKILAKQLSIPAIKGINIDDTDVISDEQKAVLKKEMDDLNNSVGKREFLYPELKTALGDALQNVAAGTTAPDKAMSQVEDASKKIKR